MSEQYYDDHIAPKLLELAKDAAAHGMTFVASVEWEPGESASTITGDMSKAGCTQYMTALSARSQRNIDGVLVGLIKRFDVSASMFIGQHNQHGPTNANS